MPDASRRAVALVGVALAAVLVGRSRGTRSVSNEPPTLGSGAVSTTAVPVGRLPAEDLAGRVAPAVEGYAPVADAVSALGTLDPPAGRGPAGRAARG